MPMPDFTKAYCDEAYGLLSTDRVNAGKTPAGFDWQQLQPIWAI